MTTNMQNAEIDNLISLDGIRGLTQEAALAFLAEKRTFIEGRGDSDEYLALADEYESIGAESCAASLRTKAQGMRGQRGL